MGGWNTAPVYPGVWLDLGDTAYEPGTGKKHLYRDIKLIPDKDKSRINKLTKGNSDYITRPYSQSDWKPKVDSNLKKSSKPTITKSLAAKNIKAPALNSWINKNKGIWNYGKDMSLATMANAYKTGDFSKVSSYLTQHKDLANYLNNIYSKRGGNLFGQLSINLKPILGTPGYGIHVGNSGVTLSTPNGQTTDITNSHNVSKLINNGNYKAPNLGTLPTNLLDNTPLSNYLELSKHDFNRADIRYGMRDNELNPYSYSGSDRKLLRTYLNNPTTDNYTQSVSKIVGDGKVLLNMLNKAVLNLTDKYQLPKPLLVNLKFKQGGRMINKYTQGGQSQYNNLLGAEQQAIALVKKAMQGDLLANLTIQLIMLAADLGDLRATQVALLLRTIIQQMKGSRKARLGAKLDYIKLSIGECPEGEEVVYFKRGGEICKACQGKKMLNGGKSDPIKDFKKKKELVKESYQRNPATRGKSTKEIAEMQKKNRQEASQGKGESPAPVASWRYKKK